MGFNVNIQLVKTKIYEQLVESLSIISSFCWSYYILLWIVLHLLSKLGSNTTSCFEQESFDSQHKTWWIQHKGFDVSSFVLYLRIVIQSLSFEAKWNTTLPFVQVLRLRKASNSWWSWGLIFNQFVNKHWKEDVQSS